MAWVGVEHITFELQSRTHSTEQRRPPYSAVYTSDALVDQECTAPEGRRLDGDSLTQTLIKFAYKLQPEAIRNRHHYCVRHLERWLGPAAVL